MFLPGECWAMSMMTKSAERPTSMIPQSSSRIRRIAGGETEGDSAGSSPSR